MNNYIQKLNESGYWISFWVIIFIPIFFSLMYIMFSLGQNHRITTILKKANLKMGIRINISPWARLTRKIASIFKDYDDYNEFSDMIIVAVKKVNGWNFITTLYACLYYALNFWSVAFSVFSVIVIGGNDNSGLDLVCTVLTAVLLCSTLFLKLDQKWMTFKNVLSKARKETNWFIYCLNRCCNPYKLIRAYSNRIISIEETLTEKDLL